MEQPEISQVHTDAASMGQIPATVIDLRDSTVSSLLERPMPPAPLSDHEAVGISEVERISSAAQQRPVMGAWPADSIAATRGTS